jgi:predicted small metal-binding protein
MAKEEKQVTCPVCGYTDAGYDAAALEDAMTEHMRQAHNMTAPVNIADTDLKKTGRDNDLNDDVVNLPFPVIAPGAPGPNNLS